MDGFASYLNMGGHGGFIWSAYGMVFIVLLGLWLISRRYVRLSKAQLDHLDQKRPHRQESQTDET
ncbi:MAG: heme exporter protein CcmD [Rhodospirillales bacterium]|nr:heme exporter protein CcmD [Rhodospirillales bacterium]